MGMETSSLEGYTVANRSLANRQLLSYRPARRLLLMLLLVIEARAKTREQVL